MANEDDILQRIILEGSEEVRKELSALGADGEAALKRIETAGNGDFGAGLRKLSPDIAKFQDGMAKAAAEGSKLPGVFGRIATAVRALKANSTDFGKDFTKQADDVTTSAKGTATAIRGLAFGLSALGKLTGVHEISTFARALRFTASAASEIALPALIGALGSIAHSAAGATTVMQELAFSAGELPATFAAAANAALAVGGSTEALGKSLARLPALTKAAAREQDASTKTSRDYHDALDKASDANEHAVDALAPIAQRQRELNIQLAFGCISLNNYHAAQRQLNGERERANQQIAAVDRAEVKLSQDYLRNRNAALDNASALTKLGLAGNSAFAKLDSVGKEDAIANALKNLSATDVQKKAIALELFGENARNLFPSLLKGADGMKALRAESERIAPTFTDAQNAIGDRFLEATSTLSAAIGSLKNAFGLAIAPAFVDFINLVRDALVSARPAITTFGEAFGTVLKPILDGIGVLITSVVVPAFQILSKMFSVFADNINSIFGTNLTGAQLFVITIVSLVLAFAPLVPLVILAAKALSDLWTQLQKIDFVKSLLASAQDAWDRISKGFAGLWKIVKGLFKDGVDGAAAEFEKLPPETQRIITDAVKRAVDGLLFLPRKVLEIVGQIGDYFTGLWEKIVDGAANAARRAGQFLGLIKPSGTLTGETGDFPLGLAGGGSVRGPGTGTSDSILARLSNGEFVMQMRAVRKYGLGFMAAVNSGKLDLKRHLQGFNLGGLVQSMMPGPIPRFASGGPVTAGGLRPALISFDGVQFEAMMSDNTLESLQKKSVAYRSRRAGKRPSYIGG
jgi:hypothetical protein